MAARTICSVICIMLMMATAAQASAGRKLLQTPMQAVRNKEQAAGAGGSTAASTALGSSVSSQADAIASKATGAHSSAPKLDAANPAKALSTKGEKSSQGAAAAGGAATAAQSQTSAKINSAIDDKTKPSSATTSSAVKTATSAPTKVIKAADVNSAGTGTSSGQAVAAQSAAGAAINKATDAVAGTSKKP